MGVTLHTHHCMGRVKHMAINERALNCMGSEEMPMDMDCCHDSEEELRIAEMTPVAFDIDLQPELIQVAITSGSNSLDLQGDESYQQPKYHNYKPPLIDRDIPVVIQSFLI